MSEAVFETVYVRRKFVSRSPVDGRRRSEMAEYRIWTGMIARCSNPKSKAYKRYGGRGIDVCARWREDFANFYADMGRRPSARHSIDRIDNDGNYEPGNCRWATPREQVLNRSESTARWTEQDVATLKRLFDGFYAVEEIAVALNRTVATIRLRIHYHRLRRPGFMTRLVRKHQELREVLIREGREAFIDAVDRKTKGVIARQKNEKQRKAQEKAAKIAEALQLDADRNEKIRLLRKAGLNLSEIGSIFGISRERIRQIEACGFKPVDEWATGSNRKISRTNPENRRQKIDRLCRAWNGASREARLMFLKAAPNSVFTKLTADIVEAVGADSEAAA